MWLRHPHGTILRKRLLIGGLNGDVTTVLRSRFPVKYCLQLKQTKNKLDKPYYNFYVCLLLKSLVSSGGFGMRAFSSHQCGLSLFLVLFLSWSLVLFSSSSSSSSPLSSPSSSTTTTTTAKTVGIDVKIPCFLHLPFYYCALGNQQIEFRPCCVSHSTA